MAENYRMINTKFWLDGYIQSLDILEDRMFMYFLTNEHTNLSGIYELPFSIMQAETKMDRDKLLEVLEKFKKDEKIYYIEGYVFVKNFMKYQKLESDTQQINIARNIKNLPEKLKNEIELILGKKLGFWIHYTYGINTTSIKRKEKVIKGKVSKSKGKEKNGFSLLDFFKKSFFDKFGSDPAISEERDLQIIEERIGLFKNEQEGKDFITAYFNSDKGEEYGYTLTACFTDHTINLFKTGNLKQYNQIIDCDGDD